MYPLKDGDGNIILGTYRLATGTFTANDQDSEVIKSTGLTPVAIRVWGTFSATVDIEKSYDAGDTWVVVKQYTSAADEIYEEVEAGVQFRLSTSVYSSGTVNYRLVGAQ